MGRLLLVRHGQSEGNVRGVFQGQREYALSRQGRAEAQAVAEWLHREESEIEAVFSSPLGRALQTAEAIAGVSGQVIQVVEDLKERRVGVVAGLTDDQVEVQFPDWRIAGIPGRESWEDLSARARAVIAKLLEASGTVVAVSHAGFLRNLCSQLVGVTIESPSRFQVQNCSITEVRAGCAGRPILHRFNDTRHLRSRSAI